MYMVRDNCTQLHLLSEVFLPRCGPVRIRSQQQSGFNTEGDLTLVLINDSSKEYAQARLDI